MKLSLCTISFRHHLHSIDQLARWAKKHQFQGIELWGIHARHLSTNLSYNKDWLSTHDLYTSMISDYLPLHTSIQEMMTATKSLSAVGHIWGTNKLRTFAGQKGSTEISGADRADLVDRLRLICEEVEKEGQFLLLETHPNTLTDTVPSTLQLLEEVNHPALRLNFDVLHIWESGADPVQALQELKPYVMHFHLKNIASPENLEVFQPDNVYAAAGSREGMVPLFAGAVDYRGFLEAALPLLEVEASIEWFGGDVKQVLDSDSKKIWEIVEKQKMKVG